ncbi:TenA family transcriptional regulator [Sulfurisphaera javensis]|uniref:TenA family transcriptional regulator n=1 Tax=Sulfurisphaera javensis TaxID=2049879 RepID=A0AAT9GTR8_9CREN
MLNEIRKEISDVNSLIYSHQLFNSVETLKLFYDQQWYIVNHDLRSLAIMVSRAKEQDELDFFINAMQGDYEGLKILREVAEKKREPIPLVVSYTHYLSWLANYANPGEQVLALVVNLPIWAYNCKRLADRFKGKYDVRFLELFANVSVDENKAEEIMKRYDNSRYFQIAKMIQYYELQFWEGLKNVEEKGSL